MKRGTIRHRKMYDLAEYLSVRRAEAVGIITALWELASDQFPSGDIQQARPAYLAEQCLWNGDGTVLIEALVNARLVDRLDGGILFIHDWNEHCETSVHNKISRAREFFANGSKPKLTGIDKDERLDAEEFYSKARIIPAEFRRNSIVIPTEFRRGSLPSHALPCPAITNTVSDSQPKEAPPAVFVSEDNFGQGLDPQHIEARKAIGDAWKSSRAKRGLSKALDANARAGIVAMAQEIVSGEITLDEVELAMHAFLTDQAKDADLSGWGFKGFAANMSRWLPKNNSSAPRPSGAPDIPKSKNLDVQDFCEHCGEFVGKSSREATVSMTSGKKKEPVCKWCKKGLKIYNKG